jgi:hypothetical protein
MLGYQRWAACGFRVIFLEDYNSTTSALSSYSFFDQGIVLNRLIKSDITENAIRIGISYVMVIC